MPDILELPLVESISGGKTSSVMAELLNHKFKDSGRQRIRVFANTGKEREETLIFLNELDKYLNLNLVWIETVVNPKQGIGNDYKIVSFETASRNGEPFEQVITKYGIPNQAFKHCTRTLKTEPIKRYLKDIGITDYVTAIGYRSDEMRRVNWQKAKDMKQYYPLVETWRFDKEMVNHFCAKRPFNLNLKEHEGNCDLCWKKSDRKLLTLLIEKPHLINWWNEMEIKYGNLVIEGRQASKDNPPPYTFFRDKRSAFDLIEESKLHFVPFSEFQNNQQFLFDGFLDHEPSGCGSSSCNPFD